MTREEREDKLDAQAVDAVVVKSDSVFREDGTALPVSFGIFHDLPVVEQKIIMDNLEIAARKLRLDVEIKERERALQGMDRLEGVRSELMPELMDVCKEAIKATRATVQSKVEARERRGCLSAMGFAAKAVRLAKGVAEFEKLVSFAPGAAGKQGPVVAVQNNNGVPSTYTEMMKHKKKKDGPAE